MAVLLLLCSGCDLKRIPLDPRKLAENAVTLQERVCISDGDVDKWNELYGNTMDNEYAQAIAVCFYHDYGHNINDRLSDFSKVMHAAAWGCDIINETGWDLQRRQLPWQNAK